MPRFLLFLLCFLLVTIVSAQKVEVFEKSSKPEFQEWGKNTMMAQGYGFVKLIGGDTLKGTLKIEKKNNVISEYTIKSKTEKSTYTPAAVKSYGFYPYKVFTYDPQLPGNPNFHSGYVITISGVKINGMVAIMTGMDTEWSFFPKRIYFIPDKAEIASSMTGGELLEVGQINKGEISIFDAFGDGYLQRIVSGHLHLYYNPNPHLITKPLFYNKSTIVDSAQIKAMQKFVEESINEGKPLNEGIRGKDSPVSADMILVNTEVIDKAYFLKNTHDGKIYMIREDNFKNIFHSIISSCTTYQGMSQEARENLYNYKKIEEAIIWYNFNCK
jgi:hypothetical protein